MFARVFSADDQGSTLVGFDCGSEDWSRDMSIFITGPKSLDSIKRYKTKVWLFFNDSEELVGFGSIGLNKWPFPVPGTKVAYIPALAIQVQHQGSSDNDGKYSDSILSHLIFEAKKYGTEYLTLFVDKDNLKAQSLYQGFGFAFNDPSRDNLLRMHLKINEPQDAS